MPARIGRNDTLTVRARLTNTSDRAGDEVPQLYIRPKVASAVTGKRLQAYRRVHLGAGQTQVVEFKLPAQSLAHLDAEDQWSLSSGNYEVTLGTSSAGGLTGTVEVAD